jgi:hypothetical protein
MNDRGLPRFSGVITQEIGGKYFADNVCIHREVLDPPSELAVGMKVSGTKRWVQSRQAWAAATAQVNNEEESDESAEEEEIDPGQLQASTASLQTMLARPVDKSETTKLYCSGLPEQATNQVCFTPALSTALDFIWTAHCCRSSPKCSIASAERPHTSSAIRVGSPAVSASSSSRVRSLQQQQYV